MYPSRVSRLARRTFSTVSEAHGFKIAAVDNGQATSSVTLLLKAGSRYESKAGVAHALKNFGFKSTAARSALGTVRESELYGGVLSASLSREHVSLTAEFLRGDEAFFVDLLTSFVTQSKFTRHEFEEYVLPVLQAETTTAGSDPATTALDVAHAIAFRNDGGLGNSLFATGGINHEDVKAYLQSIATSGNVALLGSGISQETLQSLAGKLPLKAASSPPASASKYHGGETRVASHGGAETIFVGFGTAGAPTAALATLAAHLDTAPSVKWSSSAVSSPIGSTGETSVRVVYLPYSDASLFGFLVQGETGAAVKEAAQKAIAAFKAVAAKGVEGEAGVKSAVSKAKFAAASGLESRDGRASILGAKVLNGVDASTESVLEGFAGVDSAAVSKAATALLKSKPTFVALGNVKELPWADELGL